MHPIARAVLLVGAVAAAGYTGRLALYMFDETRTTHSVLDRDFFRHHSCLSSYTEAARLAPTGANVFDPRVYAVESAPSELAPRWIGSFEVDLYQYPPAFLILPAAAERAGLDFFTVRTFWFVIQFVVLSAALGVTAAWIGGTRGAIAAMFIPLLFLAPPTRLALQLGNFQVTAFPLAILGMIAFVSPARSRTLTTLVGGAALGFCAVSKIFPGVLGIVLLVQRRWTAAGATVGAGVIFLLLALVLVGGKPFVDFVVYQLPRIDSGQAFFWIEFPEMAPVNQSVYGMVTKLRALGVPGTTAKGANLASSVYAALLVVVAIVGARRLERLTDRSSDASLIRLRHAQLWLGLLSLASFRSPFVPDAYGLVGTLWLLTLLAAERRRFSEWAALMMAGVAFCVVLDGGVVPKPVPVWLTWGSLVIQLVAYSINFVAVLTPQRTSMESGDVVPPSLPAAAST